MQDECVTVKSPSKNILVENVYCNWSGGCGMGSFFFWYLDYECIKSFCMPAHFVAQEGSKKGVSGSAKMCKLNEVSLYPGYYGSFFNVSLP